MFAQRDPYDELYRMADEMLRDESAEMKRRLVTAILKLSPEQIDRAVDWMMETFDLVPAAAAPDPEEPQEPTIDEKVAAYRAELEAEAASKKLEASRISKEKDA